MITVGIDAGSRMIKGVVFDWDTKKVISKSSVLQGVDQTKLARKLYDQILDIAGIKADDVAGVVATGYGRTRVDFANNIVTEITCHARGVLFYKPGTRSIIEIGGQDSKFIRLTREGDIYDFAMNDRCAAGTGRFLETAAERLELTINSFGEKALESKNPAIISSMCVVFAETEIISLLTSGVPVCDIAAGIENSVASRMVSLTGGKIDKPIVFTGGVALIKGMHNAISNAIKDNVELMDDPLYTGAVGAAIIAVKMWKK
jgi:predicted CoA-substrate-specific enzyme activase